MTDESKYYVAFSHFLGIGPLRFKALIKKFGSVKDAYNAHRKDIQELIGIVIGEKFDRFRAQFNPEKKLDELQQKKITIYALNDQLYPQRLKEISDPPICLYIKGDIRKLKLETKLCIAIVGTRKPTSYGIQIAQLFSRGLSAAGFVIVSGMALGVDTYAHISAVEENGNTIAVLGCGVDIIYPPSNNKLYERIQENGYILSEFPPGHTVLPGLFVARNRIISGLSVGVLVIEGLKDSGALITARYAAEQGRDVFAPPVPMTSRLSEAPNILIKQGAKFVTSVDDILEEYGQTKKEKQYDNVAVKQLIGTELSIAQLIQIESRAIDEIVVELQQPVQVILKTLSLLELKGIIEKNSEGKYQLK